MRHRTENFGLRIEEVSLSARTREQHNAANAAAWHGDRMRISWFRKEEKENRKRRRWDESVCVISIERCSNWQGGEEAE